MTFFYVIVFFSSLLVSLDICNGQGYYSPNYNPYSSYNSNQYSNPYNNNPYNSNPYSNNQYSSNSFNNYGVPECVLPQTIQGKIYFRIVRKSTVANNSFTLYCYSFTGEWFSREGETSLIELCVFRVILIHFI